MRIDEKRTACVGARDPLRADHERVPRPAREDAPVVVRAEREDRDVPVRRLDETIHAIAGLVDRSVLIVVDAVARFVLCVRAARHHEQRYDDERDGAHGHDVPRTRCV